MNALSENGSGDAKKSVALMDHRRTGALQKECGRYTTIGTCLQWEEYINTPEKSGEGEVVTNHRH